MVVEDQLGNVHPVPPCTLRLSYSVGFTCETILDNSPLSRKKVADRYDPGRRPGAGVLEVTSLLDLSRWPTRDAGDRAPGTSASGAQLRSPTVTGLAAFATNTAPGTRPPARRP
jgi:hypothetical protein